MGKKALKLISPLLIFFVLFVPYSIVNREFVVEWFGCGCPKVDELGNIIHPDFNANDFTALFWLFVSACVTAIAAFLAKGLKKAPLKVLYITSVFLISLLISYCFMQALMWN